MPSSSSIFNPQCPPAVSAFVRARYSTGVAFTISRISTSGICLVGPLTLACGEQVAILLEIAGRPFEVRGEVVSRRAEDFVTDRVEVRFLDLDADAREVIGDLASIDSEATCHEVEQ